MSCWKKRLEIILGEEQMSQSNRIVAQQPNHFGEKELIKQEFRWNST